MIKQWRAFEQLLSDHDLSWGLHYAPADLRFARTPDHRYGAVFDPLPEDYLRFVSEVGYPVLGFQYYDRSTFSFLPPEAMGGLSPWVADTEGNLPEAVDGPTPCPAFFAGFDLSEINGWAFGAGKVWSVEDSMLRDELGTFTEWLGEELTQWSTQITSADPAMLAQLKADDDSDGDPHRLFDYSLESSEPRPPYSQADLALHWVKDEAKDPYAYGLIDDDGKWLIRPSQRFLEIRPFRNGVAEVIVAGKDATYSGPWSRIDTTGTVIG
jgi:hypothetical protein